MFLELAMFCYKWKSPSRKDASFCEFFEWQMNAQKYSVEQLHREVLQFLLQLLRPMTSVYALPTSGDAGVIAYHALPTSHLPCAQVFTRALMVLGCWPSWFMSVGGLCLTSSCMLHARQRMHTYALEYMLLGILVDYSRFSVTWGRCAQHHSFMCFQGRF